MIPILRKMHPHKWEVRRTTYANPVPFGSGGTYSNSGLHDILLRRVGTTTYLMTCACGEVKTIEVAGAEVRGVYEVKFKPAAKP
jgi:hypothetical protein